MGEVLLKYYKHVTDEMGMNGKVKLAMETKIPSTQAAMTPDSPENINMFKAAVQKITGKAAPTF